MKLSKEEQKLNWYAVLESGSMTAVHNLREYIKSLEEENEQLKKQWHDCFLSCSSPYCAGHFPAVKMEGELGNMSKHEGE